MAPIALCHLTRDHLTRSLKSRNATVGDKTWNPGFKSVTLLKVTGGLMDRRNAQKITEKKISVHEPFNMRFLCPNTASWPSIQYLVYKSFFIDLSALLHT